MPTPNPQQLSLLADSDEANVRAASLGGGPREPETGGVQTAGLLGKEAVPMIMELLGKWGYPSKIGKGTTAPTSIEERNLPQGVTYEQAQEAQAQRVFDEKGYARWRAKVDERRALAEQEQQDPSGVMKRARQALINQQRGVGGEAGAMPGDQAEAILRETPEARAAAVIEQTDFNFDLMRSGEDVKATIATLGEKLRDPVWAAKRGYQGHGDTLDQAAELLSDEVGFTKKVLKRTVGQTMNASEMTALRVLLQASAEKTNAITKQVLAGDDSAETLIKMRQQMAITSGLYMAAKGTQTEIARALNAMQIPVGVDLPPEYIAQFNREMVDEYGGRDLALKIAKGWQDVYQKKGAAAANGYANRGWAAKTKGAFLEMYLAGMLGWTRSQMRNILGNGLFQVWQLQEEAVAGLLGTAERGLYKAARASDPEQEVPEGVYLGEPVMRMFGWHAAWKDAWIAAWRTLRTETPGDIMSKAEQGAYRQIDAEQQNISHIPYFGQAWDVFGKIIRGPFSALMAADDWFKTGSKRGEMYTRAYRAAKQAEDNGASRSDALDVGTEVVIEPRLLAEETDFRARYDTLTDDLGRFGKLTRILQSTLFGRMLIPFAKAPSNAVRRVAERHPAFFILNPRWMADAIGKNGTVKRQKAMARFALGSASVAVVADLYMNGRITGARPTSQREVDMLPPGWQPYSFVFRDMSDASWLDDDGNVKPMRDQWGIPNGPVRYISYAGVEPVGAMLGVTAAALERMHRTGNPDERDDVATATVLSVLDYFQELPFLHGLSSVIKSIEYDDPSILLEGTLGNLFVAAPVPYSAAVSAVTKAIDPDMAARRPSTSVSPRYDLSTVPETIDGELKLKYFGKQRTDNVASVSALAVEQWQNQIKRVPGFIEQKQEMAINYDVLGRPKEPVRFDTNSYAASWNLFMPFHYQKGRALEEWEKELIRLGMPLSNRRRSFKGIQLSEREYSDLIYVAKNVAYVGLPQKFGGSGRRDGGLQFRDAVQAMLFSRGFAALSLEKKQSKLRNLETQFFEAGMEILQGVTAVGEQMPAPSPDDADYRPEQMPTIPPRPELYELVEELDQVREMQ